FQYALALPVVGLVFAHCSRCSLIPLRTADVIIGFEPAEAVRCLPYLKKGGTVIVNANGIMPVTASLGGCNYSPEAMVEYLRGNVENTIVIDGDAICKECGSAKVLNVALLGAAAASGMPDITLASLEKAIGAMVPERFIQMNLDALAKGASAK
ncbi:MAG: 2-oxoacid:acceptor oxidoreductase family protein, partial [Clostridia bacterium]|nr:2-oxoacid:acceptor oxidoreductase family protein [Clostridia bacterium]